MAGAFSGHIIHSYYSANQARSTGPFGQQSLSAIPVISTHRAMSFNPEMHGTFPGQPTQPSFSVDSQPSYLELSDATTLKIAALQAKLKQKLGPEYISQRPGPGGPKLTYVEGWKMINLANEVFGFNGWSSTVVSLTTDFIDFNEETRRYTVGVTAIMRVTLRDGVFHEDIGYGMLENSKSKGAALDKCKKEAVTDGLKRALRNFGNLLGNCLYDKAYTQEVIKIKVSPPKFDKSELYRRPEFDESKPNIASTSTAGSTSSSNISSRTPVANALPNIKVEPAHLQQPQQSNSKPISSLPSHMRSEIPQSVSARTVTPDAKGKGKAPATPAGTRSGLGLHTPLTTPAQAQPRPQSRPPQAQAQASYRQPPPPQQPAPERKVSFAEPVPAARTDAGQEPECGDESFSFNSDDDAFLATVDLGEGDLGRPILGDEDLGRPIDYEEGVNLSVVSDDGVDATMGARARKEACEEDNKSECLASSRVQQNQQQYQGQGQCRNTGASSSSSGATGMLSRLLPNQPPQPAQRGSHVNNSHPNPNSIPNQTTKPPSNRPNENYNPYPNHANSGLGNTAKRSSTPCSGVFNFPPGVDPSLQASKSAGPPQRQTGSGPVATSLGAGIKRGADVMQSSSSRRPVQGMGLAQQQHGGQGTRREPLGRLEIGEGGDVKRVKR